MPNTSEERKRRLFERVDQHERKEFPTYKVEAQDLIDIANEAINLDMVDVAVDMLKSAQFVLERGLPNWV